MEFRGSVKKVTYYNQENGYGIVRVEVSNEIMDKIILELEDDHFYSNTITVVSTFTTLPFIDMSYDFSGEFEYSKYGLQFRSDKTVKTISDTKEGIIAYLSSNLFKGIGEKSASKVYDALGDSAIKVILEDKNALNKVNISKKSKDIIYDTLKKYYKEEESLISLLSLGLSLNMASRIIKVLGDRAYSIVKENPYSLIEKVDGIGFLRADEIAYKAGIEKNSPYRLKALIVYALNEVINNTGDTFININDLYLECLKLASSDDSILSKDVFLFYIKELREEKKIIIDESDNVYDVRLSFYENEIGRFIVRHLNKEVKCEYSNDRIDYEIKKLEDSFNIEYNQKQKEAIKNAFKENISIITGGPGTGKSTIVKGIINLYCSLAPDDKKDLVSSRIKLLAPTGRAAKRLREITMHSASTIHKALAYTGHIFTIDELECDLVIIDEFSMVDSYLAYHLFKAIKDDTKIVIVGDSDQLPSIGPGDLLNDLILCKEITVTKLDKIHRQAKDSNIISLAHSVNSGSIPYDLKELKHDMRFISCDDSNIISLTLKTIDLYLNQIHLRDEDSLDDYELKEKEKLVNDIQILIPLYKGALGIDAFNFYMQEHYNPLNGRKQLVFGNKKFRIFDKVIQLVNRTEKNVMNGDIGYIYSFIEEDGDITGLTVRYNFGDVDYNIDELSDINLAYAISIHKAQGSEFNLVITPFSFKYYVMLKKKLIYTAITRAKKYLIMLGNIDAIRKGITFTEEKRKTKLVSRIRELIVNPNIIFDANSAFDEVNTSLDEENNISPYDFMEE